MISASYLGLHKVERYAPLGAADGEYREGVCSEGADYLCNVRNGVYSCRPCTAAQLAVFKDLQTQINRIISAKKMSSYLLLDVDGRIGSKTATSLGHAIRAIGASDVPRDLQTASSMAMNAPFSEQTYKEIAKVGPSMDSYMRAQANAMGAPKTAPLAPSKPDTIDTGPATPKEEIILPTETPRRSKLGYVVGGLAVLAAIGLVGVAAYQKSKRG